MNGIYNYFFGTFQIQNGLLCKAQVLYICDSCKNMCNWVAEAAALAVLSIAFWEFFLKSFGSLKFSVVYVIAQCNNFAETVFMLRAKITNTKLRVTHVCTPLLRQFWKRIAPICLKEDFKKKLTTFFNEHFGGKLHHENFPR